MVCTDDVILLPFASSIAQQPKILNPMISQSIAPNIILHWKNQEVKGPEGDKETGGDDLKP